MPHLACRECGASVDVAAERCPSCESKTPFACAVCGKALGSVSLSSRRSHKHPHGPFSPEGEPLCPDHRLTRCYECEQLFPLVEMSRQVVGKREDTNLRKGMKPRIEEVFGHFCPQCVRDSAPSRSKGVKERSSSHRSRGEHGSRHGSGGERSREHASAESAYSPAVSQGRRFPVGLIALLALCLLIPLVIFYLGRPGR